MPAKAVRPFVAGNKNDAHDARAIWTAAQQPGVKTVAIKNEEQQAMLVMHRMRQQLVKFRTAQINGLRGLLTEYGEVMPKGRAGISRAIAAALEGVAERLPAMIVETLREQWTRVVQLDREIGEIERRIKRLRKVRQSVMATRSDRDPPSLHASKGEKLIRGNEARIGRFHQGQRAQWSAQRPDTKLQSACPSHQNRSLRSRRRPYKDA